MSFQSHQICSSTCFGCRQTSGFPHIIVNNPLSINCDRFSPFDWIWVEKLRVKCKNIFHVFVVNGHKAKRLERWHFRKWYLDFSSLFDRFFREVNAWFYLSKGGNPSVREIWKMPEFRITAWPKTCEWKWVFCRLQKVVRHNDRGLERTSFGKSVDHAEIMHYFPESVTKVCLFTCSIKHRWTLWCWKKEMCPSKCLQNGLFSRSSRQAYLETSGKPLKNISGSSPKSYRFTHPMSSNTLKRIYLMFGVSMRCHVLCDLNCLKSIFRLCHHK